MQMITETFQQLQILISTWFIKEMSKFYIFMLGTSHWPAKSSTTASLPNLLTTNYKNMSSKRDIGNSFVLPLNQM